jgi:hypothetical protein
MPAGPIGLQIAGTGHLAKCSALIRSVPVSGARETAAPQALVSRSTLFRFKIKKMEEEGGVGAVFARRLLPRLGLEKRNKRNMSYCSDIAKEMPFHPPAQSE